MHTNHISNIIAAACILYNMCEVHGERFNNAWLQDVAKSGSNFSTPPSTACRDGCNDRPKGCTSTLLFNTLVLYITLKCFNITVAVLLLIILNFC